MKLPVKPAPNTKHEIRNEKRGEFPFFSYLFSFHYTALTLRLWHVARCRPSSYEKHNELYYVWLCSPDVYDIFSREKCLIKATAFYRSPILWLLIDWLFTLYISLMFFFFRARPPTPLQAWGTLKSTMALSTERIITASAISIIFASWLLSGIAKPNSETS